MTTDVAEITKKLGQKQVELGLSDAAFAAKLGISRQLWNFVKSGAREPGMKVLKAVTVAFPELTVEVMNYMRSEKKAEAKAS